jgi:hypothetical protein
MYDLKTRNHLGFLLNSLHLNGNGIEIGVDNGIFSNTIMQFGLKKVYLLDSWKNYDKSEYIDPTNECQSRQDEKYKNVTKKMLSYGNRCEIIRADSRDAFKQFEDNFFDFIYIDANHKYEAVKLDMENWFPKVRKGGVFSGHDYLINVSEWRVIEVKKAVDEFCNKLQIQFFVTKEEYPSWWFIK